MSGQPALSRFTPSLMPHDLLERLFVGRERTLEAAMARVTGAVGSSQRNHTLLVGPRGAGKTHLLSLVYHRTQTLREGGTPLQLSWLPEDPWAIVSYTRLLRAIVERLEPAVDEEIPSKAAELESLLRARAVDGVIVVLVENLDAILKALGNDGQQKLRHLLQVDRSLLVVATSTRLDRSLSDQASPFYGFFTTTRLEPFDVAAAAAMLSAIAHERGDDDLVAYLAGDQAQARLRTITHLAGGQPRIWATLASALTVDGLDDLVDLLLTRFDDLTPYYQEQLARLSPQQRLVVIELAQTDRPVHVSELAERLGIEQRSVAKTMTELNERGWAKPTESIAIAMTDRRRTYYELAEPLARLSFQLKASRGEPIRLIVDFLKHWFDAHTLSAVEVAEAAATYVRAAQRLDGTDDSVALARQLVGDAVEGVMSLELVEDVDAALAALATGDADAFLRLPVALRAAIETLPVSSSRLRVHLLAMLMCRDAPPERLVGWVRRAEAWYAEEHDWLPRAVLINWLGRSGRDAEADEVARIAALEP